MGLACWGQTPPIGALVVSGLYLSCRFRLGPLLLDQGRFSFHCSFGLDLCIFKLLIKLCLIELRLRPLPLHFFQLLLQFCSCLIDFGGQFLLASLSLSLSLLALLSSLFKLIA